ncbi:hypothetical protein RISK_002326 [Rhodopirellula islandica]|uniref:Uncharacterized protein n=1 Tax=Rhodopirellula islandica TaxID=595434 RepID=A0A0J1EJJ9_RHOIS|nr:hypothetical protein RISK_002326 [Rhodopirellula islandica]
MQHAEAHRKAVSENRTTIGRQGFHARLFRSLNLFARDLFVCSGHSSPKKFLRAG